MKYRKFVKKREEVEAIQWFKNGDHPLDGNLEGTTVRHYRNPNLDGQYECPDCNKIMHEHGWINNYSNSFQGEFVCPGDYIIKGFTGEYACKPSIFERTYDECEEEIEKED